MSVSGNQLFSFKIVFFVLTAVGCLWLVAVGAVIFSLQSLSGGEAITRSLANGSVYLSILCLTVIINVAIIFPAILLLQPSRLWHVLRAEKQAITPRQRFRGMFLCHGWSIVMLTALKLFTLGLTTPPMPSVLAYWLSFLHQHFPSSSL